MPLSRGEVVAVPYPFTDLTGTKTRPALVVSTDIYNQSRPDILVAALSTQLGRVTPFDTVLSDWKSAGLRYPSVVKGRVVTLAQSLVLRSVGRLSAKDQAGFDERLLAFLSTDESIREAFIRRMLWTALPGDRLQSLAERMVEAVMNAAPKNPRCNPAQLLKLLARTP